MKQRKLSDDDRKDIQRAANAVLGMCDWSLFPEGREYWDGIYESLSDRARYGTTDGKPWIEPELTDEDAKQRPWVMVRDGYAGGWYGPARLAIVNGGLFHIIEMPSNLVTRWRFARRATPEEIEAANADR
jgi:hypothetical protein